MLFHANWCGYCVKFAPVWKKLKVDLAKAGIETAEYESQNQEIMQEYNIQGYPTLIIEQNGETQKYSGMMNYDSLASYFNIQSGGAEVDSVSSIQFPENIQINRTQSGGAEVDSVSSIQFPENIQINKTQSGGAIEVDSVSSIQFPEAIEIVKQSGGAVEVDSVSSIQFPENIQINRTQSGGAITQDEILYKAKYLKYKNKYLKLYKHNI